MTKLSRRQLLLAGFFTGAGISIATSYFRDQINSNKSSQDEEGSEIAYETKISESEIRQIKRSVNLKQPLIPYNRQMSKILVRCCRLATEQYLRGLEDPEYDGAIANLPSYFSQLNDYEQITAFRAIRQRSWLEPLFKKTMLRDLIPKTDLIYAGFILKSSANNIIVFRGTQEPEEWIANLNVQQIDYQSNNPQAGKIHQGFNNLYFSGVQQWLHQEIEQLNPAIPCYVAGHSLGGAIAVLAALDLGLNFSNLREQIQMYNYAPPRVGNPTFAKFYSDLVPNSYRVVNQADSTWLLPPTQLDNAIYLHVGQRWSFINQTGDLNPNHQLAAYQVAIDNEVEISRPIIAPGVFQR
ncbi:MAG: lipase family protein [Xenococcus sp. MO_188.B8]|nr:lipase family protein [Xenococcus sp. MO_188.B8]